jgi:hypothetical protein
LDNAPDSGCFQLNYGVLTHRPEMLLPRHRHLLDINFKVLRGGPTSHRLVWFCIVSLYTVSTGVSNATGSHIFLHQRPLSMTQSGETGIGHGFREHRHEDKDPRVCPHDRYGWLRYLICEAPRYLQFCNYDAPLRLLLPSGWIRKTKAMSVLNVPFLTIGLSYFFFWF